MGSRRVAGQASVELIGVVPLALLIALAIGQLLAAGAARELAGNAAEAGATALLQGGDASSAARAALPGWSRGRASVSVSGPPRGRCACDHRRSFPGPRRTSRGIAHRPTRDRSHDPLARLLPCAGRRGVRR